ncbi:MAG TPA: acetyl-CoA hydrolase/transferase C-terminal domain-containing protein [Candidatus Acidoferrales bacterium]|nr:acetyl-CoA hydrolase/transferase C-terminal domain-containing protein [Candidatus Acidoferrales bacterium]
MANSYDGELKRKRVTAEQAAAEVKSGDWVEYGFGLGQPDLFDRALAERVAKLERVKIRGCLAMRPRAAVEADPEARHVAYLSWYFSGLERKMHDRNLAHHIPMNFGEAPDYYRRFVDVDVAVLKTAPMDAHGFFNFGPAVTYHKAITEKAKRLVVETDASMPYVFGLETGVHISEVDCVLDAGATAMPELHNPPANEVDQRVAALIAPEIPSGACIQIGIGAMPNAVCELLAAASIKDLGVHTEMFVDSLVTLYEAGKVTGAHKSTNRYQMAYTFAAGSKRMYDFLDRNAACFAGPVDYTNLPHHIMQNDRVISICNAAQIDLTGQACSESAGIRQISGTGGQLQFVRGAYASREGKSFICLASTIEREGRRASRIVARIDDSNIVTTPRTDAMYVATEYGLVNLKGKSVPERARALISIAHPDFRESLERTALDYRLLPRASF